jgi:hypothetical protein
MFIQKWLFSQSLRQAQILILEMLQWIHVVNPALSGTLSFLAKNVSSLEGHYLKMTNYFGIGRAFLN